MAVFPVPSSFMFRSLQRSECQLFNSFKNCSFCQIHSRVHLWLSLAVLTASHHRPLACPPVPRWVSRLSSLPPASSWVRSVLPGVAKPRAQSSVAWWSGLSGLAWGGAHPGPQSALRAPQPAWARLPASSARLSQVVPLAAPRPRGVMQWVPLPCLPVMPCVSLPPQNRSTDLCRLLRSRLLLTCPLWVLTVSSKRPFTPALWMSSWRVLPVPSLACPKPALAGLCFPAVGFLLLLHLHTVSSLANYLIFGSL